MLSIFGKNGKKMSYEESKVLYNSFKIWPSEILLRLNEEGVSILPR